MSRPSFNFNIAFTQLVNTPGASTQLSPDELWIGIKHGARSPHDFAPYVASCEVLSEEDKHHFRRRLTLADGAVHTAAGKKLEQEVAIAPMLHVHARTIDTGATSAFLMTYSTTGGGDANGGKPQLYMTAVYELWLADIEKGSKAAQDIEKNYTALARKACSDGLESIRKWKLEGKLEEWADE